MKVKVAILISSIACLIQVHGQTWERLFGEPGRLDRGYNVFESYDKGFCILGEYDADWIWLIKTDVNGYYLWDKVIECEYGTGGPYDMTPTSDGGVVIVGGAAVFENYKDPFVLKLDACGEKEWCKIIRKPGELAFADQIVEMDDGSLLVQTMYMGNTPNWDDVHVYKFDPNGNVLWKNVYASKFMHPLLAVPYVRTMKKISDGAVILVGDCYYPDPWNPSGVKAIRPMFVKVDSLGTEEWFLPFGLNDTLSGQGSEILELPDKSLLGFSSFWQTVPNRLFPMMCKINHDGTDVGYSIFKSDTLFIGCYDSYFWKYATSIEESTFICSVPHNYQLFDPGVGGEIKAGLNGQIFKTMQHENSLFPYLLKETSDNKFIQASSVYEPDSINKDIYMYKINHLLQYDTLYTSNYTYDSLCGNLPIQSGFISLNDCEVITGMDEIPTPEEYYAGLKTIPIKVFPNPVPKAFGSVVTFAYENTKYLASAPPAYPAGKPSNGGKCPSLRIFNIIGEKVHEERIYRGQGESRLNVGSWPRGMYIAVVLNEGRVVGRAKFVVR